MANGPPGSMGLPRCGGSGGSELPDRQYRKDWGSALDMIAELHLNGAIGIEQDIDARSEFDQADTLPASEPVSDLEVENNAARDEPGDLLEDHGTRFTFDSHDVLLVLFGGMGGHGVEEQAALIADVADDSGNRRAIDVDIKNIEKNA